MSKTEIDETTEKLVAAGNELARLHRVKAQLSDEVISLKSERAQLRTENQALRDQLAGEPGLIWWVQSKVDRQRVALKRLNQRVYNQRLVLRALAANGIHMTRDGLDGFTQGLSEEERDEIWRSVTE